MEQEISILLQKTNTFITTIPGIADTLGAIIIAEIGDISRFESPSKLVAFAGLDVSVKQSGEFIGTRNKISKRGSPYLRRAMEVLFFLKPKMSGIVSQHLKAGGLCSFLCSWKTKAGKKL